MKTTKKGASGPPVREPMIDDETHKKMLSFYHKKTEEAKKLDEMDDGDQYMNSKWADGGQMKAQMHGLG